LVSISHESRQETDARLRGVIAAADFAVLDGRWAFSESPLDRPPALSADLVAVVRDEAKWSWLSRADDGELALFSFHFPADRDNSGFVGWLATSLKDELGTGVVVVCGSNSERGGVYDYWGVPVEVAAAARQVIEGLRGQRFSTSS
jgi:hypothetical protein